MAQDNQPPSKDELHSLTKRRMAPRYPGGQMPLQQGIIGRQAASTEHDYAYVVVKALLVQLKPLLDALGEGLYAEEGENMLLLELLPLVHQLCSPAGE